MSNNIGRNYIVGDYANSTAYSKRKTWWHMALAIEKNDERWLKCIAPCEYTK